MLLQMALFHSLYGQALCVCVCVYIYIYFYLFITSSLFIYLSMGAGCFHVLTVVNSAAMSSGEQVSFQISFCLFHICPGVGLQGHMVAPVLVF